MTLVSVIVPVYNVEKYLRRCLNSLLIQTLKSIEIILVDDGSTDGSPRICDEYSVKYSFIKVVHKKNEGLGFARNSGLLLCNGEYVAFVDSDDFIDPQMLENLYEFAIKNSLDACFCGYKFYIDENHITQKEETQHCTIYSGKNNVKQVLLDMVGAEPSFHSDVKVLSSVWKGLYKFDIIKEKNIQFVSEREFIAEDMIFHLDFLPHCTIIGFIPFCGYFYCANTSSLTRVYNPERFEKEIILYNAIENKLDQLGFSKHEYLNRVDRYLLLKIRACISLLALFSNRYGYRIMRKSAKIILNTSEVREMVSRYPYQELPLKHRLFFLMVEWKIVDLLLIMYKILK